MKVTQITGGCWNTAENRMLYLKPEILYPNVPVRELESEEVQDAMQKVWDQYDAYLQSVRKKISRKLLKLYEGSAPGLGRGDEHLHDFIVRQILYEGRAYGIWDGKTSDRVRMLLDAHGDYEYELIFDRVYRYFCRNDIYTRPDLFSGMEEIVLCEIGVVEDIPGCNFLNAWTSSGCEFSIWFQKFDLKITLKEPKSEKGRKKS